MIKIIYALIITLLFSCNSIKTKENKLEKTNKSNLSCPENGVCTIEIIKNKNLTIKRDEINSIYYQTEDNTNYSIVKYSYIKKSEKGVQDASYIEEIIFQIHNSDSDLELNDLELQNLKMLFGRHCFCKGQAGYYPIVKGKMNLYKRKEEYNLVLNFIVPEVPQIIDTIKASFK